MGGKAKAPPAPDYRGQAIEQGQANLAAQREAIAANRVNQSNPWGNNEWTQAANTFDQAGYDSAMSTYNTPTGMYGGRKGRNFLGMFGKTGNAPDRNAFTTQGKWSNKVTLNEQDQARLNSRRNIDEGLMGQASSMAGRAGDAYDDPFSLDGAPAAGRAGFEVNKEYQDAIMSRLAPDLLRRRERQEAQLIAQGVGGNTGSESWNRAQQDLGRDENDASTQALMKGYDVANTEFDKSNTARTNWINEKTMMRDRPMDELLNVLRGTNPVSNPNFGNFAQQGTAEAANLSGAAGAQYGAAMDKYNAKNAQRSSNVSTAAGLGGTAIMAYAMIAV